MIINLSLGSIFSNAAPKKQELANVSTDELRNIEGYYQEHLANEVNIFETERKEQLRRRRNIRIKSKIFLAIVFLITVASAITGFGIIPMILVFFGACAIAGYWQGLPQRSFQSEIKSAIYPKIFGFFGKDFRFLERGPLVANDFRKFSILPRFDISGTGDYVSGTYNGVTIEMVEAHLIKQSSDENKSNKTVFNGMFVLLTIDKPFYGKTIIKRDGNMFTKAMEKVSKGLARIKLEDPIFEKKFEVYSDDQVEARYLLTPAFMERLMALNETVCGPKSKQTIECGFLNNKLFITIPSNHDFFETSSLDKEVDFRHEMALIVREMQQFFDIIDVLKLDQTTRV